ncbi:peptidoglycan-binding domain-containing protein [Streptomyces sp. 8N706]|uniref:peptidoglycan-binding domain-containing protein n=1 Tax=Streptomyces sp. 8N706 TaxID=3457416 RepID=UPI003FD64DE4
MNVRKRIALATVAVALGGGLVVGPAASAFAESPRKVTASQQEIGAQAACPKGGSYKYKKLQGGVKGWTANYSNTLSAVIRKGSTGKHVYEAQCMLKGWGYNPGPVDGDFGDKTFRAVKKFQTDQRITKDGIVGKNTWKYLRNPR